MMSHDDHQPGRRARWSRPVPVTVTNPDGGRATVHVTLGQLPAR